MIDLACRKTKQACPNHVEHSHVVPTAASGKVRSVANAGYSAGVHISAPLLDLPGSVCPKAALGGAKQTSEVLNV